MVQAPKLTVLFHLLINEGTARELRYVPHSENNILRSDVWFSKAKHEC